jgi:mRNA-degrading endonuclease RelE of RelBE toxin-antitoxin system
MKFAVTRHFERCYRKLPLDIQKQADAKLRLLAELPKQHPSLRVKRIQGTTDIWEASITMNYRLTFQISKDTIILRKIGKHKEVLGR